MISTQTNLYSLIIQNTLNKTTKALDCSMEQLSTGLKINSAKDDAAGYEIAQSMNVKISGYEVAEDNISQGIDIVNTASETLELMNDLLIRLKSLSEQAQNDTYGVDSIDALNNEALEIIEELERLKTTAEYNGIKLFDSDTQDEIDNIISEIKTVGIENISVDSIFVDSDNIATQTSALGLFADFSSGCLSVNICDKYGDIIATSSFDEDDTINSLLIFCKSEGMSATINNGVISVSSGSGLYIEDASTGGLIEQLGISTETSTAETTIGVSVNSSSTVTYSCTVAADESSLISDLVTFSGSSTIYTKNSSGKNCGTYTVTQTTIVGDLLDYFNNSGDIQATITDGVISLAGINGYYAEDESSGGVLNLLGLTTFTSATITVATGTTAPTVSSSGFINSVSQVDTSTMTALSSISDSSSLTNGTYVISTAAELAQLATMTNAGLIGSSCTFVLGADIDLTGYNWTPIGNEDEMFTATFDGNGYTISNLYINSSDLYAGLFGIVYEATIKNVGLVNVDVTGDTSFYSYYVGGLAAMTYDCDIYNCYVTGTVTEGHFVGGLIGYSANGDIIDSCYVTGTVSGYDYVGGLVGGSDTSISSIIINSCYTSISVSKSSVSYGEALTDEPYVGELIGLNTACWVKNCTIYNGSTTAIGYSVDFTTSNSYTFAESSTTIVSENSSLSDLGINSSQYITVVTNGILSTLTLQATSTFASIIAELTAAGLDASLENGIFTITGNSDVYVAGISEDLENAINLSSPYSTSSTITTMTNSTSSTLKYSGSTTISLNNTLDDIGISNTQTVVVNNNGTEISITIETDNTISELISKLKSAGITSALSGGKFKINASNSAYITSMSSDLINALKLSSNFSTETEVTTKTLGTTGENIITIQVGLYGNSNSKISFDTSFSFIGLEDILNNGIDSDTALDTIDELISQINGKSTMLGAVSNRLESALDSVTIARTQLVSSLSTIQDADIAEVSTEYLQNQIIQSACATLLATANQSPSIALALI